MGNLGGWLNIFGRGRNGPGNNCSGGWRGWLNIFGRGRNGPGNNCSGGWNSSHKHIYLILSAASIVSKDSRLQHQYLTVLFLLGCGFTSHPDSKKERHMWGTYNCRDKQSGKITSGISFDYLSVDDILCFFRVVKTVLLANGHFVGVAPAIFVVFVDFWGLRSKIPCFCGWNAISEFPPIFVKTTCFRPFSKTTVFQNDRFDNPDF